MTQRGISRSAVLTGLLVLAVLVGGRMLGSWHAREAGHLLQAEESGSISAARHVTHPKPAPKPSVPGKDGSGSTVTAGSTPGPGPAGKPALGSRPPATAPGGSKPGDPTFGAKRFTGTAAVGLTFDDGPQETWTPQVLDLLRAQGVKATFCLVGMQVHRHPELVARIVREGHTLCNHSWQHDIKLGQRPAAEIRSDLLSTNAEIRRAVPGARVAYYRQPGGAWTPTIVKTAKDLGMTPLGWAVDPADWDKPGTQAIIDRVTQHTHPGSIVLMHDGGGDRTETLAACRTLIPQLKQKYRLTALR